MHTPGPWYLHDRGVYTLSLDKDKDSSICIAATVGGHSPNENRLITKSECLDNARLIAAAPDLLEVVIDMLRRFGECRGDRKPSCTCPYCPAARAYEKATGKEWE